MMLPKPKVCKFIMVGGLHVIAETAEEVWRNPCVIMAARGELTFIPMDETAKSVGEWYNYNSEQVVIKFEVEDKMRDTYLDILAKYNEQRRYTKSGILPPDQFRNGGSPHN